MIWKREKAFSKWSYARGMKYILNIWRLQKKIMMMMILKMKIGKNTLKH